MIPDTLHSSVLFKHQMRLFHYHVIVLDVVVVDIVIVDIVVVVAAVVFVVIVVIVSKMLFISEKASI